MPKKHVFKNENFFETLMNFFYMIASLANIFSIFPRFSMKFSTGILAPSHFVADDPFPLISFFPEHFEWLMGAVPQFVAVLQKHKLNLVLKLIDDALG